MRTAKKGMERLVINLTIPASKTTSKKTGL